MKTLRTHGMIDVSLKSRSTSSCGADSGIAHASQVKRCTLLTKSN